MRDAFVSSLHGLAEQDPDVMLLTGDLGFGVLAEFAKRFPRQYLNVGVAEQNLAGIAAGLALSGKRVFTYSIANFPTLRCLEQIRNDICYHDANVTIVAIGGGLSYGPLGFSHQATEDLAILRALPNMTVVAPGHDREAAEATTALAELDGPCYLRLDRSAPLPESLPDPPAFALGRAVPHVNSGADVLVLTTGAMLGTGADVTHVLAEEGLGATLVSVPTIKPFDRDMLAEQLGRGFRLVVTVEEHSVIGGLGSVVAEHMATPALFESSSPLLSIGLPDVLPTVVGSQTHLRQHFGLDAATIATKVVKVLAVAGG